MWFLCDLWSVWFLCECAHLWSVCACAFAFCICFNTRSIISESDSVSPANRVIVHNRMKRLSQIRLGFMQDAALKRSNDMKIMFPTKTLKPNICCFVAKSGLSRLIHTEHTHTLCHGPLFRDGWWIYERIDFLGGRIFFIQGGTFFHFGGPLF